MQVIPLAIQELAVYNAPLLHKGFVMTSLSLISSLPSLATSALKETTPETAITTANEALPTTLPNDIIATQAPTIAAPERIAARELARMKQIAETAAKELATADEYIDRLRTLAVKAADASLTSLERTKLNRDFQKLFSQLERFAEKSSFDHTKLFDGNFSIDAATTLAPYLFTGAANAPTAGQAALSLSKLFAGLTKKGSDTPINLSTHSDAAEALAQLTEKHYEIRLQKRDVTDFSAALDFAKNTVYGVANNGPSITQRNALNDAKEIAKITASAIEKIQGFTAQLHTTATHATKDGLDENDRLTLVEKFAALRRQLDATANDTKLPDGSPLKEIKIDLSKLLEKYFFIGDPAQPKEEDTMLSISNINGDALFGAGLANPNSLLSKEGADNTLAIVSKALSKLVDLRHDVLQFHRALTFAERTMKNSQEGISLTPAEVS